MGVVIVLSLATIPLGVLISALRDPTLRRRSRFWQRFAGLVICMFLPWMVGLVGALSEQAAFTLLCLGLAWALLLVALAPLLLFRGPGSDPGSSDDGGGGPGPGDDRRPPDRPVGGIPLPDGAQPASRVRGHHTPRRAVHPRRAVRGRERRPSRVLRMRPWPSLRHRAVWMGASRHVLATRELRVFRIP
jgi:hypothetical protein